MADGTLNHLLDLFPPVCDRDAVPIAAAVIELIPNTALDSEVAGRFSRREWNAMPTVSMMIMRKSHP